MEEKKTINVTAEECNSLSEAYKSVSNLALDLDVMIAIGFDLVTLKPIVDAYNKTSQALNNKYSEDGINVSVDKFKAYNDELDKAKNKRYDLNMHVYQKEDFEKGLDHKKIPSVFISRLMLYGLYGLKDKEAKKDSK